MTDLNTEIQEENEDPDFYADETLAYISLENASYGTRRTPRP